MADHYWLRGIAYDLLDDSHRAIDDFTRAIAEDPSFTVALNNRGAAYVDIGEYDLAIQDLDKALLLDASNVQLLVNRAIANAALGRTEASSGDVDRAVALGTERELIELLILAYMVSIEEADSTEELATEVSAETIVNLANDIQPALVESIRNMPATVEEAMASLEAFTESLDGLTGQAANPWVMMRATNLALVRAAAADDTFLERLMAQDQLLDGVLLEGAAPPSGRVEYRSAGILAAPGSSGASAPGQESSGYRIFFVNGVMNTAAEARVAQKALEKEIGYTVDLVYNRSAWQTYDDYKLETCRRALELDNPPPGVTWAEYLKNSVLSAACLGIDVPLAVVYAYQFRDEVRRGAEQLIQQWFEGTDVAKSAVNDLLVPEVIDQVAFGKGVLLIGHSQGTMFVNNAADQVDRWWIERVQQKQRCGPPPVAVLYISPALPVENGDNQRYVLLDGDIIYHASGSGPTVSPIPEQGNSSLVLHYLKTYLMPKTTSLTQIRANEKLLRALVLDRAEHGETARQVRVNDPRKVLKAEEGESANYMVTLGCEPRDDVTIRIEADKGVTVDPAELVFDPSGWDQPQEVSLSADVGVLNPDDPFDEYEATIRHTSSSRDPSFNGLDIDSELLLVFQRDDLLCLPGREVKITPTSGETVLDRKRGSDEYQVVLTCRPGREHLVTVSPEYESKEISILPGALVFDDADWEEPKSFVISRKSSDDEQPTRTTEITHTVGSSDPNFQGVQVASIMVTLAGPQEAAAQAKAPVTVFEPLNVSCDGRVGSYYCQGMKQLGEDRYFAARKSFEVVIREGSGQPADHIAMAITQTLLGEFDEADGNIDSAVAAGMGRAQVEGRVDEGWFERMDERTTVFEVKFGSDNRGHKTPRPGTVIISPLVGEAILIIERTRTDTRDFSDGRTCTVSYEFEPDLGIFTIPYEFEIPVTRIFREVCRRSDGSETDTGTNSDSVVMKCRVKGSSAFGKMGGADFSPAN